MGAPLFNFGLAQEDERTEADALRITDGTRRVFSVASAGEMPLSLLAMGAVHVDAVDVAPFQVRLARLKHLAAVHLPRVEAMRFIGYLPAPREERRRMLAALHDVMDEDDRAAWRPHGDALLGGIAWSGRFERYLHGASRAVVPLLGRARVEAFLACGDLDEQRQHFERVFHPRALKQLFRLLFHPRLYARRGMDPRGLSQRHTDASLGDQFFGWFRALCTATPARDNHLLQLFLLGHVIHPDAAPAFLSPHHHAAFTARAADITWTVADALAHARGVQHGTYNAWHLSNLPDWMTPAEFGALLERIVEVSAPGTTVMWRTLHADVPVPAALARHLVVDVALGHALRARDRFPFYRLHPATVMA